MNLNREIRRHENIYIYTYIYIKNSVATSGGVMVSKVD